LVAIAADLKLKMDVHALHDDELRRLTELARLVTELANLPPLRHHPYVGENAFAHKGGMHVSGLRRNTDTYEHIDPAAVGNRRRVLVSDLAGKATVLEKLAEYGIAVGDDDPRVDRLVERLKTLESQGYQ